MVHVTSHAIIRYQERVANVSAEEAREALSSKAIQTAALIGASYVKLPSKNRVVLDGVNVVTVLPPHETHFMASYVQQHRRG